LIGLVLLLGVGLFALNRINGTSEITGSRQADDRNFKLAEPEQLGKIFLADRKGNTTTLTRKGENWTYNGRYPANDNVLKNLLEAIGQIEMQFIPANAAVSGIVKNLASEGILVELYDTRGKKVKGYYIGRATPDERGTYAIMEGAEQPYVVHLPGWVGNLRFRFNLLGDEWRSRRLLEEDIEQLTLVSVEYPTQRNESFVLERRGEEEFMISPYYETDQPRRIIARGRAEQYLVNFEKLFVSAYANFATEEKADLIRRIPFAIIRLERKDGSEMAIKVFPRVTTEYDAVDPNTDASVAELSESGYNLLFNDDADFGTIATETLRPFMRSYAHF